MAMSRSLGATVFTTRLPIRTSPTEISSSPAIMRSSVLLPQPEGPTRTQNSPSAIETSTPWTTSVLPNDLRTPLRVTAAMRSVDLGLWHGGGALEEVEVAALVGLADMLREQRAVAALVSGRRRLPFAFSAHQLGLVDPERKPAACHVELDQITVLHQCERAADEALRCNVQHAGAVRSPAHACVGDAHHIAHAPLQKFFRNRQLTPLRHARAALRAGTFQDQHRVGIDLQPGIVDPRRHVVIVREHYRSPGGLEQPRICTTRLDHCPSRREFARRPPG